MSFAWDYRTWLNLALPPLSGVLAWRFVTTGGSDMLRMMEGPAKIAHGG